MKCKQLVLTALTLVFLLSNMTVTASAYDAITMLGEYCALSIDTPQDGIFYEAYRICSVTREVAFTPTDDFAGMPALQSMVDAGDWSSLTNSAASWVASQEAIGNAILPKSRGRAVANGDHFTTYLETLATGLYYIHGVGGGPWYPSDFVICLPNWENESWSYRPSVNGKGTAASDTTSVHVLKRWRGDDRDERPDSIDVQLIRTERATDTREVYDTVTLSSENGWTHLWTDLDNTTYSWSVSEFRVPSSYEASYLREGVNFVITNRIPTVVVPPTPPEDPPVETPPEQPPIDDEPQLPDDPVHTPDGPPNIPSEMDIEDDDTPLSSNPFDTPEDYTDIPDDSVPLSRLPQTGLLWWPVPILAVSGMALCLLGYALQRRDNDEKE